MTVALLGDLLSGTEESAAQGSGAIINKLTGFTGPAIAGTLAGFAWQYPFYLYIVGIPVGIIVYLYYEEDETVTRTDPVDEDKDDDDCSAQEYGHDLRRLVSDPFVVGILAGFR